MVGTLRAVPLRRNGDCDPHKAQIDIPVNLPRTSFALHFERKQIQDHKPKADVKPSGIRT